MSRAPVWTTILCHHSASLDTDGVDERIFEEWHEIKGWQDIGYHWVVEDIGGGFQAVMGRSMAIEGSHQPGMNHRAIGVCFAGNFSENQMELGMLEEGAKLIAGLCYSMDILTSRIHVHRDYKATECPGEHFPIEVLRKRVQQLIDQH